MLKVKQTRHQARRGRRATGVGRKEPGPFPLEDIPVNQRFQLHQFMAHVDHLDEAGAPKIVLFRRWLSRLHFPVLNGKIFRHPVFRIAVLEKSGGRPARPSCGASQVISLPVRSLQQGCLEVEVLRRLCGLPHSLCGSDKSVLNPGARLYTVSGVPSTRVAWLDRKPPLPCATARFGSRTCRAPAVPASCW